MLPERLTRIDETNRADHFYLDENDHCLFFGEYFSGTGYQGGPTNQLIFNYKCKPSVAAANPSRRRYKEMAVEEIATALRRVFPQTNAERFTWVPIPTSKVVGHPDYDDRLERTLGMAFGGYNADIRMLLRQSQDTKADHETGARLSPDALLGLLTIDQTAMSQRPIREGVVLFDDVLTTGKHFKCCERRLREVIPPEISIVGIFVARRIYPDPAAAFEDLTQP